MRYASCGLLRATSAPTHIEGCAGLLGRCDWPRDRLMLYINHTDSPATPGNAGLSLALHSTNTRSSSKTCVGSLVGLFSIDREDNRWVDQKLRKMWGARR